MSQTPLADSILAGAAKQGFPHEKGYSRQELREAINGHESHLLAEQRERYERRIAQLHAGLEQVARSEATAYRMLFELQEQLDVGRMGRVRTPPAWQQEFDRLKAEYERRLVQAQQRYDDVARRVFIMQDTLRSILSNSRWYQDAADAQAAADRWLACYGVLPVPPAPVIDTVLPASTLSSSSPAADDAVDDSSHA